MRQKPRTAGPRGKASPPHRRSAADIPAVATFQPDPPATDAPEEPQDEQAAETVRRMVEAAYT
ncbi:hypothetical protein [Rhodopila sp.]|uniref:hypothetical protein n=1 Tax=Rhodopila sp. TaxID=2480087 RepID=UPI003D0D7680